MKTFLLNVLKKWELKSVRSADEDMVNIRKDRFTVTPDEMVRFVAL